MGAERHKPNPRNLGNSYGVGGKNANQTKFKKRTHDHNKFRSETREAFLEWLIANKINAAQKLNGGKVIEESRLRKIIVYAFEEVYNLPISNLHRRKSITNKDSQDLLPVQAQDIIKEIKNNTYEFQKDANELLKNKLQEILQINGQKVIERRKLQEIRTQTLNEVVGDWFESNKEVEKINFDPNELDFFKINFIRLKHNDESKHEQVESAIPEKLSEVEKENDLLKPKQKEIYEFSATIEEISLAIASKKPIEGINILKELQNPDYKFQIKNSPDLGTTFSEALVQAYNAGKSNTIAIAAQVSLDKRKNAANKFAIEMHPIIQKLRSEKKLITYKETIEALNKEGIKAPKGGKWAEGTLQAVYKRWKDLGLSNESTPKPE